MPLMIPAASAEPPIPTIPPIAPDAPAPTAPPATKPDETVQAKVVIPTGEATPAPDILAALNSAREALLAANAKITELQKVGDDMAMQVPRAVRLKWDSLRGRTTGI